MSASISNPRYTHAEGYTAIAFGKTGQFLCTGGSDSLVRVFYASKSERDQEAITLEVHSDNVLSLATSRNKIISGDEEGMVSSFGVGSSSEVISVEPAGTVLRSILPARDISISSNEKQVAIASDDEHVRVVSLLDMALLHTLSGHRGAVNSVSFSPDAVFLASTGCDGTLRVWDMRDSEPTCVHIGNKLSYVCEPGNSMEQYKMRWSPDGKLIAIPGADNSIKLVERNSWEITASLGGVHTRTVAHLAWSSNSRYIASVSLDNKVAVWDVAARKSILCQTTTNTPCQVDWNPRSNMLGFTDSTGALFIWDDVVPVEQGHAPPFDKSTNEHGTLVNEKQQHTSGPSMASNLMSDLFDDTAAVDGGAEGDMDEDDDIDDEGEETADVLDDFVVDDDGAGYTEHQTPKWTPIFDPETHSFQPGSTPWINNRRYLAFNMVGSVVSIAQDASYNTIEVEFYDKSMHRDFHFSDSYKFSMAALSESGCLFATTSREFANDQSLRGNTEPDETSVISYKAFASWSTNADWVFKMPPKEHPRCIAASTHGAAAVTSQGMLRLFTCGGAQCHVESLPNRVVTCVAHRDLLLLVLESPGSIKSNMGAKRLEYEYILMTINGQSRLAAGSCPVTLSSEVVWAGFSEEGHPAVCDSKGMLRVLHKYWRATDAIWVPILDSRALSQQRGKREAFWPVAVSAKQFIVVTCRNKARYPPFPKPILDELDVEIPLLQTDSQVGQQEARYLGERLFFEQQCGESERTGNEYPGGATMQARDELEQDKLLLRLIQLSCKADKTQRAIDLAAMIRQEKSFDAAIKIAVFQKQSSLAERLMRLKESKFVADFDYDDAEDEGSVLEANGRDSDLDDSSSGAAPRPYLKARPKPAARYGKKHEQGADDEEEEQEDGLGDGDEMQYMRPPLPNKRPSGSSTSTNSDLDSDNELAARPTRPPTTTKPFNPFGVKSPSKSMNIKRSDSFFNAVDQHSAELSQESAGATTSIRGTAAAATTAANGPTTSSKRQKQPNDDDSAAPRKQAKKTSLLNFKFKKDDRSPSDATAATAASANEADED